jgi:hypothetical protein
LARPGDVYVAVTGLSLDANRLCRLHIVLRVACSMCLHACMCACPHRRPSQNRQSHGGSAAGLGTAAAPDLAAGHTNIGAASWAGAGAGARPGVPERRERAQQAAGRGSGPQVQLSRCALGVAPVERTVGRQERARRLLEAATWGRGDRLGARLGEGHCRAAGGWIGGRAGAKQVSASRTGSCVAHAPHVLWTTALCMSVALSSQG